jgi:hypothetical protein
MNEERNKIGRFTNGNSGKPKGAVNRTTKEARQILTEFLIDKAKDLPDLYDAMDIKDRATLILHLSKLLLPRPENVDNHPESIIKYTVTRKNANGLDEQNTMVAPIIVMGTE